MSRTASQMSELGTAAPPFDLPAANPAADGRSGDTRSLGDFSDAEALVVVFTCNHCPYAQHVEPALVEMAKVYRERGVAFAAICANDAETHPQDSFEKMAARAEAQGFPFPYLRDESQEVARSYGATCTPDFFVYGPDRTLAYRGRFDATRPNGAPATGADLREALDQLLAEGRVQMEQQPSVGCNIKWMAGKAVEG